MKSGKCPKCKSNEIYVKEFGLSGTTVDGRSHAHDDSICINWGYYESYITDQKALQAIPAKAKHTGDWKKAG